MTEQPLSQEGQARGLLADQFKPYADWHEEDGDVLWTFLPIEEPPYCGRPNDSQWPFYHVDALARLYWHPLPQTFRTKLVVKDDLLPQLPPMEPGRIEEACPPYHDPIQHVEQACQWAPEKSGLPDAWARVKALALLGRKVLEEFRDAIECRDDGRIFPDGSRLLDLIQESLPGVNYLGAYKMAGLEPWLAPKKEGTDA